MKSLRPHPSPLRRRSIARSLCLYSLLLALPLSSIATIKPHAAAAPDVPSGFLPGLIHYFAGNGDTDVTPTDGSIPTLVSLPQLGPPAVDSHGNIYFSSTGALYVVYAGGPIPQTLKNITNSPQQGFLYGLNVTTPCGQVLDLTCGEGLPLNQANFGDIAAIAFDSADNMYISDGVSDVIRKVDATTSIVTTIAGQLNNPNYSGDGGPATAATLDVPYDIKLDHFGNVFISEQFGTAVRVVYSGTAPPAILAAEGITGAAAQPGTINTIAGQATAFCPNGPTTGSNGNPGACGDYGPATGSASFFFGLNSIEVDAAGNVYAADAYAGPPAASYIRVVYAGGAVPAILNLALGGDAPTAGYIYAVTGYGANTQFALCAAAPCGDGGLAADMELGSGSTYLFLRLDSLGNLYIADSSDYAIRKLDTSGYASTVAGIDDPNPASPPTSLPQDGGPATATQLDNGEVGIAFDAANNLYFTDNANPEVWRVASLAPQTIDFGPLSSVSYGDGPITLSATSSSGLPVSFAVTSGPGRINGSGQLVVRGAGTIEVTASQAGNGQYAAAASVSQSLTVDPASLTVTAEDATKVFGAPNPPFSAAYSGFVNGDTQTSPGAVSGTPAFSTTATTNSPQGTYPITVSIGSLTASNYTFTDFVPGTLTIGGNTAQTINFAALAPITYGRTTVTLSATASSGLPVTFQVVSGPGTLGANGTTLTVTGAGTIVITASQPGGGVYEAATPVTRNLVVNKASLTITGPTVTLPFGVLVNTSTFPAVTITGFAGTDTQASIVTGSAIYTAVTGKPSAGTYQIAVALGTLALVPSAAGNYVLLTPPNDGTLIVESGAGYPNPLPGHIYYFAGNGPGLAGAYADGSLPTNVPIANPTALATDSSSNVYIATGGTIYVVYAGVKIPATLSNITATPILGRIYQITGLAGLCGSTAAANCGESEALNKAAFGGIAGMAFDTADNLYISDAVSNVVRKVDATSAIVTTVAGQLNVAGSPTNVGDGGLATNATLNAPSDIKLDQLGNLYIVDRSGAIARVVYVATASGPPPILAAAGIPATAAQPGFINTIAGQVTKFCAAAPTSGSAGTPGACGDFGPVSSAAVSFLGLNSLAVDTAGNVYFADAHSGSAPAASYIRVAYAGATVPTTLTLALNGAAPTTGYLYGVTGYGVTPQFALCTAAPCGDGGLAANVQFGASANKLFLDVDASGNLYLADSGDYAARQIDAGGNASTVAGIDDPNQAPVANPPAAQAGLANATPLSNHLFAIAVDPERNLYLTDTANDLVWQVAPLLAQQIAFPAFDPSTVAYGVAPITLTATSTSGLPVTYAVTSGPGSITGSQLTVAGKGTIIVTASQAGSDQYAAATPVPESLTVNAAPLTVTANSAAKFYGDPNPAFTATITGFVNTDSQTTPGLISGTPALTTTATATSPQGTYPIDVSVGTLTSTAYTFTTFVPGTLTISGNTTQTITFAPPAPINYGQTNVALTATASSGLPVTFQVVGGPGTLAANGSTLTVTGAGTIVITASQAGSGPYEAATSVTRNLMVNPAPLTVTGPTVTLPFGTTVDPTTFPAAMITGFVGADTQSSVVTGAAQYTTQTGTPNAGSYPITVGLGTLTLLPAAAPNYVFTTPMNGTLVIAPAAQTINFNPIPAGQVYGNLVPLTAVSTSSLPVTFTATGPARFYNGNNVSSGANGTVQLVLTGVGSVTVTATQAGSPSYAQAPPVVQAITVGPAPLNIGVAQFYTREQGAQNPVFQPQIGAPAGQPGGFVNGDSDVPAVITGIPLLSTDATPSSAPGVYAIVPSQGSLAAANYYFVYLNGQLTVTPPGSFSISASPSALTIGSGLTGQSTLTITPINVYQGVVTLSCGQVPANVTCVISPSTYVFPGAQTITGTENNAQGTITITASGGTVVGALAGDNSRSAAAIFLIPAALGGLLIAFTRKQAAKRSRVWTGIALLVLGAGMAGITSCGGSSKMTTAAPGATTIMITGSGTTVTGDGAVSASLPFSVTIQ